jgi:hypothetical protein
MPRTAEDVENYLLQLDRRFENDGGTYLLQSTGQSPGTTVAIRVSPPIVAFRVIIGPVPADEPRKMQLFRMLLQFNASDLMHVSYGVDTTHGQDQVVLSGALELENLDMNELEAMLSDIDLALARHVPALRAAAGDGGPESQPKAVGSKPQ